MEKRKMTQHEQGFKSGENWTYLSGLRTVEDNFGINDCNSRRRRIIIFHVHMHINPFLFTLGPGVFDVSKSSHVL